MDRAQVRRRRDAGSHLAVRETADDERDDGQQSVPDHLETRLDEDVVERLLERRPARLLIAHPDQDADEHGRHVLQHMATVLVGDRKSTRLNSSHSQISYAVFCLKKKKKKNKE